MTINDVTRSEEAQALTEMVLTLFRVNNLMLTWGDRLVAPLGLTSARWQILGAIVAADRPQPVAWIARDLGANRQNVQRIVNDLAKDDLVQFQPNPHHRRAHLVVLTVKGQRAIEAASKTYAPSANALAEGFPLNDINIAHGLLLALRRKLEGETDVEEYD
ncbi:MarR family winged helix-turn-helix transcriptional regulator [Xanthobacter sp. VNH20]|uniref:MarR family winged helix-turn-helix transcriptional regulator n=1 Tax=Xanthobacter sp. VNH20 TaxID=3156616 RepID=UPI0032B392FC